jgi:hypothetical protein
MATVSVITSPVSMQSIVARPTLGYTKQGQPSRRLFRIVQTLLKRLGRQRRAFVNSWLLENIRRHDIGEFWLYFPKRSQ